MNFIWKGSGNRRHQRAVRRERSEGWRLLRAWLGRNREKIIVRVLGVLGLFLVWGGLLLVASADNWTGGQLILVGVVCGIAWTYLYISEVKDPR